ncbi:MAG: hypothetical protein U5O39_12215 [Gammaproteobacteria bacterium]|nr:hypothetical protein [Gammaproteobacteria bacterium]
MRYDDESGTTIVDVDSIDSDKPANGNVRAAAHGRFVIEAGDEHQTQFSYVMHMELGGNLPAGVANNRMVKTTFEDLERLKEMAVSHRPARPGFRRSVPGSD